MPVLGLSAYHQDASAALVVDGRPVAAVRESLSSKIPLDSALPLRAAQACLGMAQLTARDLDAVVFYERPLLRFERSLAFALRPFPSGARAFAKEVSQWFGERLWTKGRLADEFDLDPKQTHFVDHLDSHAACAFFQSPFPRAAVLVLDDEGEWATAAVYRATATGLERLEELHLPHSLGLLVSAITQFLGFEPGRDEPILEALALRGTPRFQDELLQLVQVADDGSLRIDTDAFHLGTRTGDPWSLSLEESLGAPREAGAVLRVGPGDSRDADLAASLQAVLETRVVQLAQHACAKAGEQDLCLGGVLANNRGVCHGILAQGAARRLFVPPEPGNAGASLGAALLIEHAKHGSLAPNLGSDSALGPRVRLGQEAGWRRGSPPGHALLEDLHQGSPVGWVHGALELASTCVRSRLALIDARSPDAHPRLMRSLQRSADLEAPRLVLREQDAERLALLPPNSQPLASEAQLRVPVHSDLASALPDLVGGGSVWLHVVGPERDPALHGLLDEFHPIAGGYPFPALLSCELRLQGGVPPQGAAEARSLFARSGLDALLVEDELLRNTAEAETCP